MVAKAAAQSPGQAVMIDSQVNGKSILKVAKKGIDNANNNE